MSRTIRGTMGRVAVEVDLVNYRDLTRAEEGDIPAGKGSVELLERHGTFKAIVESERDDVLIGAIVLEDLDLLVDCRTQTLQPRDPGGIITEIE